MAFEGIEITSITEAHINALIGVSEGRDLDFKQATYGNADNDKREFLADISAFANTVGGHIVIGVAEDAGVATGLTPFLADADAEIQRLESITLTGLQPRIVGMRIRAVPLVAGGNVIVMYIPRSWNGPHRVIAQSSNRFYMRAGTRKYEPDVEELRQLFTSGPTFTQRLRDFQYERIAKITAGASPMPLMDKSALILHILPYSAFLSGSNFEVSELGAGNALPFPMGATAANNRVNLDGIVSYSGTQAPYPAYTQIWRNGCIEAVRCPAVRNDNGQRTANIAVLGRLIINGCKSYLAKLNRLGVKPPVAVIVTMTGTKDGQLIMGANPMFFDVAEVFDRDMLFCTEVIIDAFPQDDREIPGILRPIFNQIANAGGYEAAPNFNANGDIVR